MYQEYSNWDDDDDTYTNDFYCAMTLTLLSVLHKSTTVARGIY